MLILLTIIFTAIMTGIIWFVQINHYPLMLKVGRTDFVFYEKEHAKLAARLIAPLMLIELTLSFVLVFIETEHFMQVIIAFAFLIIIWVSTFAIQVPLHQKLAVQHNEGSIKSLIRTNWIRTVGWTLRLIILGAIAS